MNAHEYRNKTCIVAECDFESITNDGLDHCDAETGDCSCTVWDLCMKAEEHDRLLAIIWKHVKDGVTTAELNRTLKEAGFVANNGKDEEDEK